MKESYPSLLYTTGGGAQSVMIYSDSWFVFHLFFYTLALVPGSSSHPSPSFVTLKDGPAAEGMVVVVQVLLVPVAIP